MLGWKKLEFYQTKGAKFSIKLCVLRSNISFLSYHSTDHFICSTAKEITLKNPVKKLLMKIYDTSTLSLSALLKETGIAVQSEYSVTQNRKSNKSEFSRGLGTIYFHEGITNNYSN